MSPRATTLTSWRSIGVWSNSQTVAHRAASWRQPFVSASLFDSLLELYLSSDKRVVASSYADTLGVPALFDCTLFPELLNLSGDKGAKSVIINHRHQTGSVDFPRGSIDLDRLDDYKALAAAGGTPDAAI